MRMRMMDGWKAAVGCCIAMAVGACAHQSQGTANTPQMLVASGFQMKPADSPEKLAHVQSLPQRKITPIQHQGQLKFVWADAQDCKCLYVGDQSNYQSYAKLAEQEKIARENYQTAQAADEWGTWQPEWGPEWWWW